VAGVHAKHNALSGVTGVCNACHNASGTGSQAHYDHANALPGQNSLRVSPGETAFLSAYNAKSGAASFNATAFTCSNVSCHGGQATPNWQTGAGTIDVNTQCTSCHAPGTAQGAPENNSPYSGLHSFHLGSAVGALCTECHDMANGTTGATNHFRFLNTPQMEGPAAQTVAPLGVAANYNAQGQTCGTFTCHGMIHSAFSWTGGANHSVPFLGTAHTSVNQAGYDSNCAACHDAGSTVLQAPVCSVCHTAGSPLTVVNCASCHGDPPSGTTFPNVAGSHARHDALSGVTGVCTSCHDTFDTGSRAHYDHANARSGLNALRVEPGETRFLSAFNAKSGTASFNATAFTCSNVSCHGGLAAPNWRTGTINAGDDAGCRLCHALGTALGVPENNSPFSGLHSLHLGTAVGALCTECHDMANGTTGATNHFRFLNTPQMEGPSAQTVAPLGVAANYNAQGQTCGTFTCHGTTHDAFSWAGGASHSVPFLSSSHTSVNQAGFDATCRVCHAVTGSSPLSTAPACTVCHAAGSPLTAVNCASCHARPPSGTAFPNVAGVHAKHNALPGVSNVCGSCHNGFDTGSQAHYDHANARPGQNSLRVSPGETAFLSAFNARSGTASFNATALTCSNVSCHGGQTTPSWQTGAGTINVNTQCTSCHAFGTAQFNGASSGEHNANGDHRVCTNCHSTTKLADPAVGRHFLNLVTTTMEVRASVTIGGTGTQIPEGSYTPGATPGTGSCDPGCHGRENW
jgi:predicted CxxxxCH...CXXCH cytochrome family protein